MNRRKVICLIILTTMILGLWGIIRLFDNTDKYTEERPMGSEETLTEENSEEIQPSEKETQSEAERPEDTLQQEISLRSFLENALKPVGTTMYIWGGGWNESDTGAGVGATYIGLYPKWREFTDVQDADYDYKQHRYELENGLDCSGFVGWAVYNTFETGNGKEGYVTKAKKMAAYFANKGWGHLIENPKKFLPGDIVSMEKHVWICLGTCSDDSVLLVHASPPGVSVCGTRGIAAKLAKEYMSSMYPEWQHKYPKREVSDSYVENVKLFRWTEETMSDVKDIQSLSGEEMIKRMLEGAHYEKTRE